MLTVSTGYKNALLGGHAFASIFNQGAIHIYNGARPSTTNDLPGATLIATISNLGLPWAPAFTPYGLKFVLSGGYVLADPLQTWRISPIVNDLANWWRLVAPGDSGLPSVTDARIDGDVGLRSAPAGQELLLDSLLLSPGTQIALFNFYYTIPPVPTA